MAEMLLPAVGLGLAKWYLHSRFWGKFCHEVDTPLFSETKRERESTTQWFSFVVSFPCLADVFIFKARRFHFTDTAEDVIRQCFCFKDVKVNSWSQLPCAQKPLTKHTLRTGEGGEGRGGDGEAWLSLQERDGTRMDAQVLP
jgi:hypothetical protein